MRFELEHVHYMPTDLKPGVLYASDEFDIAIHLCACGCGSKIRTPLGSTEWKIKETKDSFSLYPSIGNWQQPCKSHYWISRGKVEWASQWSDEEILAGRHKEEKRRQDHYDDLDRQRGGKLQRIWNWLKSLFTRR